VVNEASIKAFKRSRKYQDALKYPLAKGFAMAMQNCSSGKAWATLPKKRKIA